jgi:hypothetical protein
VSSAAGNTAPAGDLWAARFSELASDLKRFAFQYEYCVPYGAFCRRRGHTPDSVADWREIPPVPTTAFKHLDLVSGDPARADLSFRTSGTSRGPGARGVHRVLDRQLYAASLLPPFGAHLVPEGGRLPILCLLPDAEVVPDSSLSHMMAVAIGAFGADGSGWFVDPDRGLDLPSFEAACQRAIDRAAPVLVAGTAFSFVHLVDGLEDRTIALPQGSRIMETGGFKGRARELPRADLYRALRRCLGVPEPWMVNEYGMTELLSQFYDGVAGSARTLPRIHTAAPWMRSRVLDPVSLEPLPHGEPGLLCHHDLANLGSVSSILTEDQGVAGGGGIRVLGRVSDAEPRGCSIAMDELLGSASDR